MAHAKGPSPVGFAPRSIMARVNTSVSIDGGALAWGRKCAADEGRTFSYWLERLILAEKRARAEAAQRPRAARKASRKA